MERPTRHTPGGAFGSPGPLPKDEWLSTNQRSRPSIATIALTSVSSVLHGPVSAREIRNPNTADTVSIACVVVALQYVRGRSPET